MRRMFVLTGVATLLAAGAMAQSESDFQSWMKMMGPSVQGLNKDIAAKDGGAVAADTQKLQGMFKQVEDFWQKRGGADDAVGFAKKAQAATGAVAAAAAAGNFDMAAAEVKNVQANCGGCHMAHREKVGDTFKIK
jgi:hypothetical protein